MFDACSKVRDESSLNDCLYSGPCLLPAIYDILLRFRLGKIGLVSDIEQAFLNIAMAEEHRDLLRFLWYENFDADDPEVISLRFTRVVFGLTSSPFLLNGTISSHVSQNIVNEIHNVEVLKNLLRTCMLMIPQLVFIHSIKVSNFIQKQRNVYPLAVLIFENGKQTTLN